MARIPRKPGDPEVLGRFRILARLGEGGQGIVFLGVDPDGGALVAVKVLKLGNDPRALARLRKEMAAAQQVARFCTAQVLEAAVDGPVPYMVSEYIAGPSLAERVAERGPLSGGELSRLMVGTASALTAIHAAGVVHRDLKPANVILGPDGPRVVDFGIARQADSQTLTAGLVGTPAYMAPEQLNGETASRASDVFAWAGTMVYAATGRSPFGDRIPFAALLNAVVLKDPDLAGVPDELTGLLADCLSKVPEERPTARELLDRLFVPAAAALDQDADMAQVLQAAKDLGEGPDTVLLGEADLDALDVDPDESAPSTSIDPPLTIPPKAVSRRGLVLLLAGAVTLAVAGGWLVYARNSGASGPTVPAAYDGVWSSGDVRQDDGINSKPVSARLTMYRGRQTATIDFATTGCGGELTLITSDPSELTFSLAARGGPDCPSGQVRIFLKGSGLDYHLLAGALTQNGTLSRSP